MVYKYMRIGKGFLIILILIVLLIAGGALYFYLSGNQNSEEPSLEIPQTKNMRITSPVFGHNQSIPNKYTCDGENINPPLEISGVPEDAKSLALIMDDPDAPMGTWDHWIVWNINPSVTKIEENSVLAGVTEGTNSSGKQSYGGPCPPSGTHRYYFKLYALDTQFGLGFTANKSDIENAMEGHILDSAELIGLYQRQ